MKNSLSFMMVLPFIFQTFKHFIFQFALMHYFRLRLARMNEELRETEVSTLRRCLIRPHFLLAAAL